MPKLLSGPNIKYVDVYSTKELKKLAPAFDMDPEQVPHIKNEHALN
jgi:hypothetical protein